MTGDPKTGRGKRRVGVEVKLGAGPIYPCFIGVRSDVI